MNLGLYFLFLLQVHPCSWVTHFGLTVLAQRGAPAPHQACRVTMNPVPFPKCVVLMIFSFPASLSREVPAPSAVIRITEHLTGRGTTSRAPARMSCPSSVVHSCPTTELKAPTNIGATLVCLGYDWSKCLSTMKPLSLSKDVVVRPRFAITPSFSDNVRNVAICTPVY